MDPAEKAVEAKKRGVLNKIQRVGMTPQEPQDCCGGREIKMLMALWLYEHQYGAGED